MQRLKVVLVIMFVLFIVSPATSAQKNIKIGYVDLQKVLVSSDAGREAKRNIERESEEKKKTLEEKKKDIQNMMKNIEKQSSVLSEKVKMEKMKEIEEKREDFLQLLQKSERDLQAKDAELTSNIVKDVMPIIKQIGKEKGYTLILEKNTILYVNEDNDISEEVMELYNKKYSK